MKHDKARYEARCFLAEEYLLQLKSMKPLGERKPYVDYMSGKQMPASAFNNGGLDIFASYVWPEVLKEHATRQIDFNGEVWYQKTRPTVVLTPEKEHLLRDTPEQARIRAIQAELKTYES